MTTSPFNESTRRYAELVEQNQLAMLNAIESWTRASRDAATRLGSPTAVTPSLDTDGLVDQVYDFASKMLEVQRGLTKQLLNAAVESAKDADRKMRKG
ncbi:hypothetical protein BN12_40011 [Nostocoides japonicum T1-X7]|uniref:Phasin domain-containing protein n=1 Tax=Nostocoides japonicum T1-X7 TaxID=1194083 RepID=A0A077LZK1_9MICO|nr:hypothetical protein [Tetrasphaera japonica]CCH79041.1 hypothetical protein BN12_40011 [Tetrasphaera japonica T1-X7]